jgi:hypothetical protein
MLAINSLKFDGKKKKMVWWHGPVISAMWKAGVMDRRIEV